MLSESNSGHCASVQMSMVIGNLQVGAEAAAEAADEPAVQEGNEQPAEQKAKRRKVAGSQEPTLEEVEAEFWRIVESPDEVA